MAKQTKITKSAKGEECLVRIPSVCNFNPETVIFAHLGGAGMAIKSNDIHGAYCCSSCHDALDGRVKTEFNSDELQLMHYDGVKRTQIKLLNKGLIVVR
jgi:ribose 5-phosphate isomerase RpiB